MPNVVFKRNPLYTETYNTKVLPYPKVRAKFREFMLQKRDNPNGTFGASDKPFVSAGNFQRFVPGLKHAHITHDLSIVYKVSGNAILLFGFFKHDELGTGQPPNMNRQKSIAQKFANQPFTEDFARFKQIIEHLLKS